MSCTSSWRNTLHRFCCFLLFTTWFMPATLLGHFVEVVCPSTHWIFSLHPCIFILIASFIIRNHSRSFRPSPRTFFCRLIVVKCPTSFWVLSLNPNLFFLWR